MVNSVRFFEQIVMFALLDNFTILEHDDAIEASYRRKSVRDDNTGAPSH